MHACALSICNSESRTLKDQTLIIEATVPTIFVSMKCTIDCMHFFNASNFAQIFIQITAVLFFSMGTKASSVSVTVTTQPRYPTTLIIVRPWSRPRLNTADCTFHLQPGTKQRSCTVHVICCDSWLASSIFCSQVPRNLVSIIGNTKRILGVNL